MALNSTSCLGIAGSTTLRTTQELSPTVEENSEIRSLQDSLEAQLFQSEVYQRSLLELQSQWGEASETALSLVKAIGREAIRLTLQQTVKPEPMDRLEPTTHAPVEPCETPATGALVPPLGKIPKKLTKAELAAQKAAQDWEKGLRQVGEQLRQARMARSLSLAQVHSQTLIPLYQLEALEAGRIQHLPEEVYVRGFIRRVAEVLHLDTQQLLSYLPAPDPTKAVIPSWYHPKTTQESGIYLRPAHLYLGYTALMIGAVSGLGLMAQQSPPGEAYETEPIIPPDASVSQSRRDITPNSKPGLQSSRQGVQVGSDMAHPETSTAF